MAGKTALVLITDGSEELESVSCIDIMRRGGLKVDVVSITDDTVVKCANGTRILADHLLSTLHDREGYDVLVLPGGGRAAEAYCRSGEVQRLLQAYEKHGKVVAVICASTTAIHKAGVFKGHHATSYPSFQPQVEDLYRYEQKSVVVDGKLITSRGPATALEFALAIVEAVAGAEAAKSVAAGVLFHRQH
jgi:DJ-1 family protein